VLRICGATPIACEYNPIALPDCRQHGVRNYKDVRKQAGIGKDRLLHGYRFLDTQSQGQHRIAQDLSSNKARVRPMLMHHEAVVTT
jgi:hypothetical protein